jgi:hypothetical protein
MPIPGTGFLSGGQTQYINGRVTETWMNRSHLQVWEVTWADDTTGELVLADVCKFANAWDAAKLQGLV